MINQELLKGWLQITMSFWELNQDKFDSELVTRRFGLPFLDLQHRFEESGYAFENRIARKTNSLGIIGNPRLSVLRATERFKDSWKVSSVIKSKALTASLGDTSSLILPLASISEILAWSKGLEKNVPL